VSLPACVHPWLKCRHTQCAADAKGPPPLPERLSHRPPLCIPRAAGMEESPSPGRRRQGMLRTCMLSCTAPRASASASGCLCLCLALCACFAAPGAAPGSTACLPAATPLVLPSPPPGLATAGAMQTTGAGCCLDTTQRLQGACRALDLICPGCSERVAGSRAFAGSWSQR